MPSRPWSSDHLNATIEQVAPYVLALLRDGVPRPKGAIMAALSERHPKKDVERTLMRLVVTGQLVERAGKYTVATPETEPC